MLDKVSKASETVFPLNPLTWSEINNKIGGCFSFQLPVPSYLDTASGPNSSHTKRKSNLSTHPLSPSMGPCTYLESTGVPWNTKRRLGNSRRTTVDRKWEGPRRADAPRSTSERPKSWRLRAQANTVTLFPHLWVSRSHFLNVFIFPFNHHHLGPHLEKKKLEYPEGRGSSSKIKRKTQKTWRKGFRNATPHSVWHKSMSYRAGERIYVFCV